VFRDVGGYDEARYAAPSIEDIELGVRLTESGRRIVLDPEILGTHLKVWTFPQMVRTDFGRRGVPWVRLLLERGHSTTLNLGWRYRISTLTAILGTVFLLARRPRAAAVSVLALVALNRQFYSLLAAQLGVARAAAALPLHVVHLLTGAAAAAVGVVSYVLSRGGSERA
jgi:hypothetical protein